MLSIKLAYIYVLLFIIFITLCFTLNIFFKNTDIIANTNIISMIAIIIIIL